MHEYKRCRRKNVVIDGLNEHAQIAIFTFSLTIHIFIICF